MPTSDLWSAVLARVSRRIGPRSYRDWFEPTRLLAADAGALRVEVPNLLFKEWLERNFLGLVREVVDELVKERDLPAVPEVSFEVAGAERAAVPRPSARLQGDPRQGKRPDTTGRLFSEADLAMGAGREPASQLNARYTFANFIVGSCNQFAHAAARAVADAPGASYNPLYLYGGVGLGKTHLMQAIGNALRAGHPDLRVLYASAERFMCEMVDAIRWKRQPEFRDRFRNIDVLIVDDVQFLEGKEATQEEFFHTFHSLYEDGKQIILSSDCPPKELATLEERLRSRFESGLIADLQAPDLETKLAILRRKAESLGLALPDDVALDVAKRVRSNVRELEGCLTRIMALASLRSSEPTVELAREATRDILPEESRPVSVEAIQQLVADYYKVRVADLKARNNARAVAFPRQVAMYLCKKMTRSSFPDIGRRFGGKHHSTVIHSVRKIAAEARQSEDFDKLLHSFMDTLR